MRRLMTCAALVLSAATAGAVTLATPAPSVSGDKAAAGWVEGKMREFLKVGPKVSFVQREGAPLGADETAVRIVRERDRNGRAAHGDGRDASRAVTDEIEGRAARMRRRDKTVRGVVREGDRFARRRGDRKEPSVGGEDAHEIVG